MNRTEMIAVVAAVALASILVRLVIANRAFGERVNKISAKLF